LSVKVQHLDPITTATGLIRAIAIANFYFCTEPVVTFTLFKKPTHALLLITLSHPHFKKLKLFLNVL
jgi:hypothetical protein